MLTHADPMLTSVLMSELMVQPLESVSFRSTNLKKHKHMCNTMVM